MYIKLAETAGDIEQCFPVMGQLRHHLTVMEFVRQVQEQQINGYRIAYIEDAGEIKAVAGFRIGEMLSRGRFLYVDDLVTDSKDRSRGYGSMLFEWLVNYANSQNCDQLDLDSGVQRADAHRFYFKQGMQIASFHFSIKLRP